MILGNNSTNHIVCQLNSCFWHKMHWVVIIFITAFSWPTGVSSITFKEKRNGEILQKICSFSQKLHKLVALHKMLKDVTFLFGWHYAGISHHLYNDHRIGLHMIICHGTRNILSHSSITLHSVLQAVQQRGNVTKGSSMFKVEWRPFLMIEDNDYLVPKLSNNIW